MNVRWHQMGTTTLKLIGKLALSFYVYPLSLWRKRLLPVFFVSRLTDGGLDRQKHKDIRGNDLGVLNASINTVLPFSEVTDQMRNHCHVKLPSFSQSGSNWPCRKALFLLLSDQRVPRADFFPSSSRTPPCSPYPSPHFLLLLISFVLEVDCPRKVPTDQILFF